MQPAGFTCPHYDPLPGGKRCRSYLDGGSCALPGELQCREWLRVNGHGAVEVEPAHSAVESEPEPAPQQGDLFGHAPPAPPRPAPVPVQVAAEQPSRPVPGTVQEPGPPPEPAPALAEDRLRGVTTEDIESFKALGVEVCFTCPAGEVWLVPEPTGLPRRELTPEHAATIVQVLAAFPGSRVVSLTSKHEPEGSKEVVAP